MKRRLIQHSIFLVLFICLVQMMSKLSGDYSVQHPGNGQPVKSTAVWVILSDTPTSPAEIIPETEKESLIFMLPPKMKQLLVVGSQLFYGTLSVLNEGHIPLQLTDSSPPAC